jgi:unsaturated chondroitin disaccharide hydrolase
MIADDLTFALDRATDIIRRNAECFDRVFPSGFSRGLKYDPVTNTEWTPGFWTGLLWIAYVSTGDKTYRMRAESLLPSFRKRLDLGGAGVATHDLGFLYTLSCVAAFKVATNREARLLALRAAELLANRYFEGGRISQAWRTLDDPAERGRIIIDSVMNMPLLFWASRETGDRRFRAMACAHLEQVARHLVRGDGSAFHTYFVDPETGEGRYPKTHQGFSDDSCWSRGQAWAIYGFSLAYGHTGDERFGTVARRVADYFLAHLPRGCICYWDMIFREQDGEQIDTSAAAIAAAGLLDLSMRLPSSDGRHDRYRDAAVRILRALSTDHLNPDAAADGILLHGVCNHPQAHGVNESCLWGDYFYAEALMRASAGQLPIWWADAS